MDNTPETNPDDSIESAKNNLDYIDPLIKAVKMKIPSNEPLTWDSLHTALIEYRADEKKNIEYWRKFKKENL